MAGRQGGKRERKGRRQAGEQTARAGAAVVERAQPAGQGAARAGWLGSAWLPALAVGVVLLACYWRTLTPTISGGDCGELVAAVHVMGVAHPTGYPLYLIVGKLFDLLPGGEPAWRLALFSAVAAAAAGGLVCWSLVTLTGSRPGGVLGGLAAGLNLWVWANANQPEVYALNTFMICLALAAFGHWQRAPGYGRLRWLALAAGLGLAHHRTSLFFSGPLLLWAAVATRPVSARRLGAGALYLAAPLLLYAWLPWRSAHHPPLDWGYTSFSWLFFQEHVNAADYVASYVLQRTPAEAWQQAKLWLEVLWRQLTPVGLALVALGAGSLLGRGRRGLGICLAFSFVGYTAWAAFYKVGDQWVFFLPGTLILTIWLGAGLGWLLGQASGMRISASALRLLPLAGAAVALAIPANMALQNWSATDRSRDYRIREQGDLLLAGVPGNAVLLLNGDGPIFSAFYRYYALGEKPVPLALSYVGCLNPWYELQIPEPALQEVSVAAREVDSKHRPQWLAAAMRQVLAPDRPLYSNIIPDPVPEGYVALEDYPITRLVRAPGLAPVPGVPGKRPLLVFPGQAGELRALELPPAVTRGEPFPVTAAITGKGMAEDVDLQVLWAHESIAGQFAARPEAFEAAADGVGWRTVPLLFNLHPSPTPPGQHYRQAFSALASRTLIPGRYAVFVRLARGKLKTGLAGAGMIEVR